jgi:hypothetical protein
MTNFGETRAFLIKFQLGGKICHLLLEVYDSNALFVSA